MISTEQEAALNLCSRVERIRRLLAYAKVGKITRGVAIEQIVHINSIAMDGVGYVTFANEARSRADLGDYSSCTFHFAPEKK